MGGYGSGQSSGRLLADMCLQIDLAWMIRTGHAKPGKLVSGSLSWTCGGQPAGWINYEADMANIDDAHLVLNYVHKSNDSVKRVQQDIRLLRSTPNYGGQRWWMICPCNGGRCGKLYLPSTGDRFASRNAWQLGYYSQRISARDRPFEKLFRLQKKLGGSQGWQAGLERRPKGMWHQTYTRHWEEYLRLDGICTLEMASAMKMIYALG